MALGLSVSRYFYAIIWFYQGKGNIKIREIISEVLFMGQVMWIIEDEEVAIHRGEKLIDLFVN